ncbi:ArsR family transcriptional regulator [Nodularia sp. NIES-3585]|nr:ArsR family transcriptional regulator [Nodularia sp. NIES-3585]
MWQVGILSRRSEGTCAYYRVESLMILELFNRVCDGLRPTGGDHYLATRLEW